MKLGCPCETCYSRRPARWVLDYDQMPMCWVCKLRLHAPLWLVSIIDRFDDAGCARYEPPPRRWWHLSRWIQL